MVCRFIQMACALRDFLNGKLRALLRTKCAINSIYTPFFSASLLITSISDLIRLNSSNRSYTISMGVNTARYCSGLVNIMIMGLMYVFLGVIVYFTMLFHLQYPYELIL